MRTNSAVGSQTSRFSVQLRPGRDFQTVLANSLTLIRAGAPKGQAMAIALNVAGYRPPVPPSATS